MLIGLGYAACITNAWSSRERWFQIRKHGPSQSLTLSLTVTWGRYFFATNPDIRKW